jgi:hypothetical protein
MVKCKICGKDVGDFTRMVGLGFICQYCFKPEMERDERKLSQLAFDLKKDFIHHNRSK